MKERGGRRSRGSKLKFRGPLFPRGTDISERKDEISNKKVVGKRKKTPPPPQTRIDSFSLGRLDDLFGARSSIWGGPPSIRKKRIDGSTKTKKGGVRSPGFVVGGGGGETDTQLFPAQAAEVKSSVLIYIWYKYTYFDARFFGLGWVGLG